MSKFGPEMKEHFMFDKDSCLLNHGSYGSVAKCVFEKQIELMKSLEFLPDVFMRKRIYELFDESVKVVSKLVNAEAKDLVLVDNTTTGIECILNSIDFKKGDGIIVCEHTYHSVQRKVKQLALKHGIKPVYATFNLPIKTEKDIADAFVKAATDDKNVKIAIVDHITSPSGVIFPVEEVTRRLHEIGVVVLIDGAHAPGQLPVDVKKIDADFYVGNLHKWMYASHTCALMWAKPEHQAALKPLVVSKGYFEEDFQKRFVYLGTRDTCNFFTISTAFEFYNSIGGMKAITGYTRSMLDWASDYLCKELNTIALPIPKSVRAPNMLVIKLPSNITGDAEILTLGLYLKHKVQIAIIPYQGQLWGRIMANVYTSKDDFVKLKDGIKNFGCKSSKK